MLEHRYLWWRFLILLPSFVTYLVVCGVTEVRVRSCLTREGSVVETAL